MNKSILICELFKCNLPYILPLLNSCLFPWEILPKIEGYVLKTIKTHGHLFTEYQKGVYIGKNVKIANNVTFCGLNIIGNNTEIRPGAYIRGNVITGENCVIGNSTELKNCLLLNGAKAPHYNYVGDSVMGSYSHIGASTICSNLKSDQKSVVIKINNGINTGLRKVGAFLGDYCDIGSGCVLNPGTIIGPNTSVYPLTSLRGVYPQNCIVKSNKNIVARK